jgi:enolase
MFQEIQITGVQAREILDSRGNPTVEAEVWTEDGAFGRAAVPSGASTAHLKPSNSVTGTQAAISAKAPARPSPTSTSGSLTSLDRPQRLRPDGLDNLMLELDGTPNKANTRSQCILAVSLATAQAAANSLGVSLFQYLGGLGGNRLPSTG